MFVNNDDEIMFYLIDFRLDNLFLNIKSVFF